MGNGDESYVTWGHFRKHEEESEDAAIDLNSLKIEVQHLKDWKKEMERDLKTFMVEQDTRHNENQKAIGKIQVGVAKIVGMGVGAWFVLTLIMDFFKK
jgi:hypothetical protein